jgi:hypothetical protein
MSISEILDHVRLNSSVVTNGMPNATMLGDDASHYTDVEADNHSLDAQELPAPTYISSLKMTSAIERVFATPELLEAILIQLTPTNQLLRAQLISRLFHTTITTSPKIQQLLFFRPNHGSPLPKAASAAETTTRSNSWTGPPRLPPVTPSSTQKQVGAICS